MLNTHNTVMQRLHDLAGFPYTTSERSGPFWQSMLHNFLSSPLSFLGWTSFKHNQTSTNDSKSLFRTFSFTVPGWWNDLPTPTLDPCQPWSNNWKSLSTLLDPKLKKSNLYLSLLPLLACIYLNNAWDLVSRALLLYFCFFKMNRFMYSPIVSRFG